MDYFDIKLLNDVLGRFPVLKTELEQIDAVLETAGKIPGMPTANLVDAMASLELCRRLIEKCGQSAAEYYLQAGTLQGGVL